MANNNCDVCHRILPEGWDKCQPCESRELNVKVQKTTSAGIAKSPKYLNSSNFKNPWL